MATKEYYLNILNCTKTLREKMPLFVEAFVEYYGEEEREHIVEQFSKAKYFGVLDSEQAGLLINSALNEKSKELMTSLCEELGSSCDVRDIGGYLPSLQYSDRLPIANVVRFLEFYNLGEEGRKVSSLEDARTFCKINLKNFTDEDFNKLMNTNEYDSYIETLPIMAKETIMFYKTQDVPNIKLKRFYDMSKGILEKLIPGITYENAGEHIDEIKRICDLYQDKLREFNEYLENFKPYISDIEQEKERKNQMGKKYYKDAVMESLPILPSPVAEKIDEAIKNFGYSPLFSTVYGSGILFPFQINCFNEESENILNIEGYDARKQNIIDLRISYFRACGIDLGNDYEAYKTSEEARKVWPTQEMIDSLEEIRKKHLNRFNRDFYESKNDFVKMKQEIDSMENLDESDYINARLYTQDVCTFVEPSISNKSGNVDLSCVVCIGFSSQYQGFIDKNICHELNHLYELCLLGIDGDKFNYCSGWDFNNGTIGKKADKEYDTLEKDKEKSSGVILSEIINEIISQEIASILRDKGIYIFDQDNGEKDFKNTSYQYTFFLVEDFYHEFKDVILESRKNGNIELLFNRVGKENFEDLNHLFEVFLSSFKQTRIPFIIQKIKNGVDDEETRTYLDIKEKGKAIFEKMKEYSKEHLEEEQYNK